MPPFGSFSYPAQARRQMAGAGSQLRAVQLPTAPWLGRRPAASPEGEEPGRGHSAGEDGPDRRVSLYGRFPCEPMPSNAKSLAGVRARIADAEKRIVRQQAHIENLRASGRDTSHAESQLASMQDALGRERLLERCLSQQ
jgi:hypothetical protein